MNRRLILITNSGPDDELAGVAIDKESYLSYFQSPAGGAWLVEEIIPLDKPTKSELNTYISLASIHNVGYWLVVFCGHDFAEKDQYGNKYTVLELTEGERLNVPMLASWLSNSRAMLIADCCRVVYPCQIIEPVLESREFSAVMNTMNPDDCRTNYNRIIETMVPYGFFEAYSTDLDEKAGDSDVYGGIYSHFLIQEAKAAVKTLMANGDISASIATVHDHAYPKVANARNNKQHPWRGAGTERIPFVIVS